MEWLKWQSTCLASEALSTNPSTSKKKKKKKRRMYAFHVSLGSEKGDKV
jgi:hypothetical protein